MSIKLVRLLGSKLSSSLFGISNNGATHLLSALDPASGTSLLRSASARRAARRSQRRPQLCRRRRQVSQYNKKHFSACLSRARALSPLLVRPRTPEGENIALILFGAARDLD